MTGDGLLSFPASHDDTRGRDWGEAPNLGEIIDFYGDKNMVGSGDHSHTMSYYPKKDLSQNLKNHHLK